MIRGAGYFRHPIMRKECVKTFTNKKEETYVKEYS